MDKVIQAVEIPIQADISGFSAAMKDMEKQSRQFGTTFSSSIKSAVLSGKSFEDTLKSIASRISGMALSAGLRPLEKTFSGVFENLVSGIGASFGGASGANGIIPFAKGGVVSSPSFFGSGGRVGVMGEAGAEAIMPLSRSGDGRLGVKMEGGGQPVNVVFNVTTPDAEGFRRSEGQISAMLARSVGRGRRSL